MFGMSSTEFWEEEPQLYWAYRFSYIKNAEFRQKEELERMKYSNWLQGKINELAFSVVLNNAFSKKRKDFPSFEELYKKTTSNNQLKEDLEKKLDGITDKEERGIIEYNHWARL